MGAWWWLLVRGCCLWEGVRTLIVHHSKMRSLICAFPSLVDKPPEQGDTMEPISTAWLCPTIQVRNAELLLTEKQQPNCDLCGAKVELCTLQLLLPTPLSAPCNTLPTHPRTAPCGYGLTPWSVGWTTTPTYNSEHKN